MTMFSTFARDRFGWKLHCEIVFLLTPDSMESFEVVTSKRYESQASSVDYVGYGEGPCHPCGRPSGSN